MCDVTCLLQMCDVICHLNIFDVTSKSYFDLQGQLNTRWSYRQSFICITILEERFMKIRGGKVMIVNKHEVVYF